MASYWDSIDPATPVFGAVTTALQESGLVYPSHSNASREDNASHSVVMGASDTLATLLLGAAATPGRIGSCLTGCIVDLVRGNVPDSCMVLLRQVRHDFNLLKGRLRTSLVWLSILILFCAAI